MAETLRQGSLGAPKNGPPHSSCHLPVVARWWSAHLRMRLTVSAGSIQVVAGATMLFKKPRQRRTRSKAPETVDQRVVDLTPCGRGIRDFRVGLLWPVAGAPVVGASERLNRAIGAP